MAKLIGEKGVSLQGFIPVRKEPFERSEMVTQILFGEFYQILDEEGTWLYIKADLDKYEGWIDRKCSSTAGTREFSPEYILRRNATVINQTDGYSLKLPAGASFPKIMDGKFRIADHQFVVENMEDLHSPGKINITECIDDLVSIPYLWGGRCGFGTDCSGLTQLLSRLSGNEIPRDASEQSAIGETLSFLNEARTGDLAFFDDTEGMIHHVGMIIDDGKILHASGRVRIDRLDHQGIYNEEMGSYTHKLRVIKRLKKD